MAERSCSAMMAGETFPTNAAIGGGAILSSVSKSLATKTRPPRPEPDPYRYGWRYLPVTRPDGTEDFDQVPLTPEDVLFPQEDDFIVQNTAHNADRGYLDDVFSDRLNETPTAVVLADCRIDWNIPGVRPLGPDIAVFSGVKRRPPKGWDTFYVAVEGAKPLLVVEITSRSTRKNDLGVKVDFYHRANVPLYVIADVVDRGTKRQVKLIGYRHGPKAYTPIAARKDGRIYLEPLRLWLGTAQDHRTGLVRLACFDPDTGEELGDYTAISQALAASERRRAEAETRAEAELRRAQAEARACAKAEERAGDEARARAKAEERAGDEARACAQAEERAGDEARACAEAEARIRELEAALKRSGRRKP